MTLIHFRVYSNFEDFSTLTTIYFVLKTRSRFIQHLFENTQFKNIQIYLHQILLIKKIA